MTDVKWRAFFVLAAGISFAGASAEAFSAEFPCLIEPHVQVSVSTAVEGVLDSVKVDKGDFVNQGEVVATLESSVERVALALARSRAASHVALESAQVKLRRTRSKYQRAVELSGKKFVSPDEIEELRSDVNLAELQVQAETENEAYAELELERVQALYYQRFIRSPVNGVVVERLLTAGEFAQAQPILTLAQVDPLNVEVILSSDMYGKVKEGMTAQIRPEEPLGGTYTAIVKVVERVIDAGSGTFGVRIELPNPGNALPAGLECRASFTH